MAFWQQNDLNVMTFLLALLFVLMDVLNLEKTDSVNSTYHVYQQNDYMIIA